MGEVVTMFDAARWVARWEALGGSVIVGDGPWGPDGKRLPGMEDVMPQAKFRSPDERELIKVLRKQVVRSEPRLAVIAYLARLDATCDF